MTFQHNIRTRYVETGQDGIIHHSSFVVYLEVARIEFFKSIGCDINRLEQKKIFCPVIDLTVQYLKPLRSLEDIVVSISVGSYSKVRFSLNYEVLKDGVKVATATVSHCILNEMFKPIPLPEEFLISFKNNSLV